MNLDPGIFVIISKIFHRICMNYRSH